VTSPRRAPACASKVLILLMPRKGFGPPDPRIYECVDFSSINETLLHWPQDAPDVGMRLLEWPSEPIRRGLDPLIKRRQR
jgi:hypothetical protein